MSINIHSGKKHHFSEKKEGVKKGAPPRICVPPVNILGMSELIVRNSPSCNCQTFEIPFKTNIIDSVLTISVSKFKCLHNKFSCHCVIKYMIF